MKQFTIVINQVSNGFTVTINGNLTSPISQQSIAKDKAEVKKVVTEALANALEEKTAPKA